VLGWGPLVTSVSLCKVNRGIVAEGGDVDDNRTWIARAIVVGGSVHGAVSNHDDVRAIRIPGGEGFDGGSVGGGEREDCW
jgi:hypothetical protein